MEGAHFCQKLTIPCTAGKLEARLHYREKNNNKPGVILCPPHPLLAGNMDNNVITTLANTLSHHFPVLSFNYRSVGKSFSLRPELPLFEYWNTLDETGDFSEIIYDTKELITWSKRLFSTLHLVGYSFGSFIGLLAMPADTVTYTAIAPPLAEHPFDHLQNITCKSLIIIAKQDSLLSHDTTTFASNTQIHTMEECDHFFLNKEKEVASIVESFLLFPMED